MAKSETSAPARPVAARGTAASAEQDAGHGTDTPEAKAAARGEAPAPGPKRRRKRRRSRKRKTETAVAAAPTPDRPVLVLSPDGRGQAPEAPWPAPEDPLALYLENPFDFGGDAEDDQRDDEAETPAVLAQPPLPPRPIGPSPEVRAARQSALDANILPPLAPLAPPPPADRSSFIVRAREAAQAQAREQDTQKGGLWKRLSDPNRLTVHVTAGAAALIVFAGAVTQPRQDAESAQPAMGPARAAASAPTTSHDAHAETYRQALALLDEGEPREAVRLLKRAAEAGFPPAQYRLAKHYERGEGAPRDLALALSWAERAAEAGNVQAMHDVGVSYARGEGAPVNPASAYRWFREAAAYGVTDSQFNLAVLHQQGRGVRADPNEALFWFIVAARAGDGAAVDRAVSLAAALEPAAIERARARAHAFRPAPPPAGANALDSL